MFNNIENNPLAKVTILVTYVNATMQRPFIATSESESNQYQQFRNSTKHANQTVSAIKQVC